MELAGVVLATGAGVKSLAAGDRVMAFAGACFGTRIVTRASSVMKMPAAWSFEAGATVPVAFLTAHYALHHLAHLQEGERVLIHGAAGGVGMAAIQIARNAGAEIFATAGSPAKRDLVRLLGADHVFDSRTLDFAGEVLGRTEGRGVDVVLNSLAGEAMLRSLQVVRPLGRFLELGKRDFYENSRIGLRVFRNNVSYFGIDVDQLMLERPAQVRRMMGDLLALFEEGALSPLPCRSFAAADAESAFRCMQQSRHIGKVVLRMDPAPRAAASAAAPARDGLRLPADATYLVTGGLGGFGLRSARWLAEKGARNLVLVGRGAPGTPAAREIESLAASGVRVRVERCDVADYTALLHLLHRVQADMPPLRGVLHAAAVYRDGLIRNLGRGQIEEALVPKVLGALNLHRLTQGLKLDFFVLYSSATTVFGNAGQSNYIAANRFLEGLAAERRARGQPALCVGWGPIADAGYLERHAEIREQVAARMGDSAIGSAQALEALEALLMDDLSGTAVLKVSRTSLGRLAAALRAARFRDLAALAGEAAASAVESGQIDRWLAELDDAGLAAMLTDLLKAEAATVLRLAADKLDPAQPLQELGFDSLMGVELITAIEARFGIAIPVVAVSEIGTLERLAERVARELRRERPPAAGPADALGAQALRLAAQHGPELSADEVAATAAGLRPAGRAPEARDGAP
jgi:NADPH:quinone reductase-like Zn-dependent oxidoreductase/acyl carrier protein